MNDKPAESLVGQILADRYRILSALGEGGMGRVYLAEHVRMGRQCAVKVISPALASTEAAVARFNREAANASQINHPNVVQVYDFGEGPNGTLYLAMEYIAGETMSALIRREGSVPLHRAAALTKQVADALAAAHHRGIVHRDLKPDNIIVTRQHDGAEWIKVVDFGIAKAVQADGSDTGGGQTVTTVGVSIGTPEYMSPEQLAGERLDTRTDLYSLGLVFFHLLTADLPYPRLTSRENLVRRLTTPPSTLREVRPDVHWPADAQRVLDRALATELGQRYTTAGELARDLAALAATAPFDSDATVPLRSAVAQPALPPTRNQIPAAPTAPRKSAPTAVEASPVAVPPKKRRAVPAALGLAAVVLIGGALFARNRNGAAPKVTTPPPAVDSTATIVPAATPAPNPPPEAKPQQADTTTRQPTTPVTAVVGAAATASMTAPVKAPAATSTAPVTTRVAEIQRQVDGLIATGRRYVASGDVAKGRAEFRRAAQEVGNAMSLLPNNPDVIRLRDSTTRALRGVVMQCQAAVQRRVLKVSEPGFKCPSLVPGRFLGGRGRGG
jgi:serine/threonine-protein kinase